MTTLYTKRQKPAAPASPDGAATLREAAVDVIKQESLLLVHYQATMAKLSAASPLAFLGTRKNSCVS